MTDKLNILTNPKKWAKMDKIMTRDRRLSKYRELLQRFIDLYNSNVAKLEKERLYESNDVEHIALTAIHMAYKDLSVNSRYAIYLQALQTLEEEFNGKYEWNNVRPMVPNDWLTKLKKSKKLKVIK